MKIQESKNLLMLLQSAAAQDLSPNQRQQALAVLRSLPSKTNLWTITNKLKVYSSLTIFAVLVENALR